MACFHPLKAWKIGFTENGKDKYKITSYNCSSYTFLDKAGRHTVTEYIEIPCGKCVGCRLAHSRQWANRCMLELKDHDNAIFLTLTYDDLHLPTSEFVDGDGVVQKSMTLVKKDLQDFFKRLRWHFPDDHIRYFACGEYGSHTARPHYHVILYGIHLDPDDITVYKQDYKRGVTLYTSKKIESIWSKGYAPFGEVTWDSCAYVARYTLKKVFGVDSSVYDSLNIVPEFTVMSRKPGIARKYYDEHKDEIYEFAKIYLPDRTIRPPKYFDKLYEVDYPEKSAVYKAQKAAFMEEQKKQKLGLTDLNYLELLADDEVRQLNSLNGLPRKEF